MSKRTLVILGAALALTGAAWASGWIGGAGSPAGAVGVEERELEPRMERSREGDPVLSAGARFEAVPGASEARYRVREQFVNVSFPVDAVGSTRSIEGVVLFDEEGRVLPEASSLRIDLSTLRSDQSRRDHFVRSNTLQTQRYPAALFAPVEVSGLPHPIPVEGAAEITVAGDLTIRDVTRRVEWTGTAHFRPDGMRVEANTTVTFAQFLLEKPRVGMILSLADEIRLEAEIDFRRMG